MYNTKILQIFFMHVCNLSYNIPLTFEIQLISHYKVNTNEVNEEMIFKWKWHITESKNVCFSPNDLENDVIVFYVHATDICKIKKKIYQTM